MTKELICTAKNRFTYGDIIGEGIFGCVYIAKDNKKNRTVAIKIMKKDVETNINEIRTCKLLKKVPNSSSYFPIIFNIFRDEKHYYMVMEFIDGGNLASHFAQKNINNMKKLIDIAKQILIIIKIFHDRNWIINDITLHNIMIDNDHNIKFIDFGMVTDAGCNAICGTPIYMPPEAFANINTGFKKDIWAFGATLYMFLVGEEINSLKSLMYLDKFGIMFQWSRLIETLDIMKSYLDDILIYYTKDIMVIDQFLDMLFSSLSRRSKDRSTVDELLDHSLFNSNDET